MSRRLEAAVAACLLLLHLVLGATGIDFSGVPGEVEMAELYEMRDLWAISREDVPRPPEIAGFHQILRPPPAPASPRRTTPEARQHEVFGSIKLEGERQMIYVRPR